MTDPRYPIGPDPAVSALDPQGRAAALDALRALPHELRAALGGLNDAQLDTPYRAGGWTLRQLAHHVPDSHLNAYTRMKLALTEDTPIIRPYDEARWAQLPDSRGDLQPSLDLLTALHARWANLLAALSEAQWARRYHHPGSGQDVRLDAALATYAWHGRHHTAHVLRLREQRGW